MFFAVNVMVIGCFHCERYAIRCFFTVNSMLIGCCHCARYVLRMFLTIERYAI